jgi:hypothetical protein
MIKKSKTPAARFRRLCGRVNALLSGVNRVCRKARLSFKHASIYCVSNHDLCQMMP